MSFTCIKVHGFSIASRFLNKKSELWKTLENSKNRADIVKIKNLLEELLADIVSIDQIESGYYDPPYFQRNVTFKHTKQFLQDWHEVLKKKAALFLRLKDLGFNFVDKNIRSLRGWYKAELENVRTGLEKKKKTNLWFGGRLG